ncbi:perilipin-2-like isoform X1 [Brachionus plicatilis]|uniref:Perilipin-2-like isoform X1 n=1 Tax=Brachionus plicatilis TaxID=10195 RepID=A0A3M7T707_BRAPC|nr:perilipin-2-like isoform X1 [Brachionus plicatilis]
MYRKHLREQKEMESKTGLKTIDRIADIPVVNSALSNVTDYYGKVKDKNMILRTSFNLAELSVKTMAFAASPITSIWKKPIESVDSYLYGKLNDLEQTYPSINKPTDQLRENAFQQAKFIYNKTVVAPIDNIKEKTADLSISVLDTCLENRYAKLITNPLLDLTEKSLDYLLPQQQMEHKKRLISSGDHNTLRRIYDINNRLYTATFQQLDRLHFQFETLISKLNTLKDFSLLLVSEAQDRVLTSFKQVKDNTLVSQCVNFIHSNKLSLQNLESLCKNYSSAILTDVSQLVDNYMNLVKNFPLVFNGSKIKQNVDQLMSQMKTQNFGNYLNYIIEQLGSIHQALVSYTNQMFQVVYDLKVAQLFKRIPERQSQKMKDTKQETEANSESISNEKFRLPVPDESGPKSSSSSPDQTLQTPFTSPSLNENKITIVEDIDQLKKSMLSENLDYSHSVGNETDDEESDVTGSSTQETESDATSDESSESQNQTQTNIQVDQSRDSLLYA